MMMLKQTTYDTRYNRDYNKQKLHTNILYGIPNKRFPQGRKKGICFQSSLNHLGHNRSTNKIENLNYQVFSKKKLIVLLFNDFYLSKRRICTNTSATALVTLHTFPWKLHAMLQSNDRELVAIAICIINRIGECSEHLFISRTHTHTHIIPTKRHLRRA